MTNNTEPLKAGELKPCPCCAGVAEFDYDDNGYNWIFCRSCGLATDTAMHGEEDCRIELAAAWNRCTEPSPAEVGSEVVHGGTPQTKVVETRNSKGEVVCVSRQDEEGRIVQVLWEETMTPEQKRDLALDVLAAEAQIQGFYDTPHPCASQQSTARVEGELTDEDLAHQIACELASIDGYDPDDMHCGLYDLRWSGGSAPEPLGDTFSLEYLPKGQRIARALNQRLAVKEGSAVAWQKAAYPEQITNNKAIAKCWAEEGWEIIPLSVRPIPDDQQAKDAALIDWLEAQAEPGMKWIARPSTTGRGYRLHQDPIYGEYATARAALQSAKEKEK